MKPSDPKLSDTESPLYVKSVEKALAILSAFNGERRDLSLSDLIEKTELNKSAVQRFTHTLLQLGFLGKDPSTKRYVLTRRVLESANSFLRTDPLINKALPHVVELRRQTGLRVGFACIDETEVMYLIPLQSTTSAFDTGHPGYRLNVYATATGRIILAYRDPDKARQIIEKSDRKKITSWTETNVDKIMKEISKARVQGYAIALQEAGPGNVNIAAPIFDGQDNVIAAIAAIGSLSEWDKKSFVKRIAPQIVNAAALISRDIQHMKDIVLD